MTAVRLEQQGPLAHVILSRPERLNAINGPLLKGLIDAGASISAQADIRAVVISGEGRGFCSGIDLEGLKAATGDASRTIDLESEVADGANIAQHAVLLWRKLPMPVITAVHGMALGGGLQLALSGDMRIMSPGAKLALAEVHWGLVPDMAGMAILSQLLRPDVLADLVFTGRQFDGHEAHRIGLATRLDDNPVRAALALASEICALSPDAVRAAKRLLVHSGTRAEVLRAEAAEQLALFGQLNQQEAVAARLEKRLPRFTDNEVVA